MLKSKQTIIVRKHFELADVVEKDGKMIKKFIHCAMDS